MFYDVDINDAELGACIQECRRLMAGISTLDALTVCYNLTAGKLRLCCVSCKEEDVKQFVVDFYAGLVEQVEEAYEE